MGEEGIMMMMGFLGIGSILASFPASSIFSNIAYGFSK